jgi:hypothetical protein
VQKQTDLETLNDCEWEIDSLLLGGWESWDGALEGELFGGGSFGGEDGVVSSPVPPLSSTFVSICT